MGPAQDGKEATMSQITVSAHIPARTIRGFANGSTRTVPAKVYVFECDDAGRWTAIDGGVRYACTEADVIETCRKASNWADIKRAHFPMYGFHS
jgi:hypothetical protein